MRIKEVTVERYRGWRGPTSWSPGQNDVLVGPNNGGKSSLLRAVDVVLDPHRNAYRNMMGRHDFFDLDTSSPIEFIVVLEDLSAEDCDVFEAYLEGQRGDGSFGPADSPDEEFDQGDLVLRIRFEAQPEEPAFAVFARPDAGQVRVTQEHKLRIGWYFVPADLDPLKELAFYSNSVFAKLFEQVDLSDQLDKLREGIEGAKGDLMREPHVADTRERLESATTDLGLVAGDQALDFEVLDMSDRRVLQSLQLVARGTRSGHRLPLRSHGRGVLRALLLAAVVQHARLRENNLILAVEEPEQNLEPINQRLIARSLLFSSKGRDAGAADNQAAVSPAGASGEPAEGGAMPKAEQCDAGGDARDGDEERGAAQTIVSTHSTAIASALPLKDITLIRDFDGNPKVRPLRRVQASEHKFYERYAQRAIIDGLYASAVLLVEGPADVGALVALWAKSFPGNGLDERRIEVIECESIDKIPPFVRFFAALEIPSAVICDCDAGKADKRQAILDAGAGVMVHWSTHTDLEGVLAAEGDIAALGTAMEEIRGEVGSWDEHRQSLSDLVRNAAGDHEDLGSATDVPGLIAPFAEEEKQRAALAELLRGKNPSFKSARDQRLICEALPDTPPTVVKAMAAVHGFVAGTVTGEHAL